MRMQEPRLSLSASERWWEACPVDQNLLFLPDRYYGFLTQKQKCSIRLILYLNSSYPPLPLEVCDLDGRQAARSTRGFSAGDAHTYDLMLRKIISRARDGCPSRRLGFCNQTSTGPRVHQGPQRCLFESISIVAGHCAIPLPA
jgi:hypothetical protein